MKRKLYANMKRLTTIFLISIACITIIVLLLRLTVFKDSLVTPPQTTIQQGESGLFSYKLNSKIYFATATSKGNVLIENPAANDYLMSVSIVSPTTEDTLIYTGFIEPGTTIETAKLDIDLENGVYPCIAKISVYDRATRQPKGSKDLEITLYVGEKPQK